MVAYYEEKVIFSREVVIVCVPHDEYSNFLRSLIAINNDLADFGKPHIIVESLRPNVKRLTKGAISYADFKGAYF